MECGCEILTKTSIGHENYVEFAFPCPTCAIELRFGMNLDQEEGNFEYVNFLNIEPVVCDDIDFVEHPNIIKLDSSFLIPNDCPSLFSPFIMSRISKEDLTAKQTRLIFLRDFAPFIKKLTTHSTNPEYEWFNQNLSILGFDGVETQKEKLNAFLTVFESFSGVFIPEKLNIRNQIKEKLNDFTLNTNEKSFKSLINVYDEENRLVLLLKEIRNLRLNWMDNIAYILIPMYDCLNNDNLDLANYHMCQKRFRDLKSFYIDCSETFCRISVLVATVEGSGKIGTPCIPKKSGTMSVAEFEVMENGSKVDILKNLNVGCYFHGFIDSKLRNGVGHHSAHYDIKLDIVKYRNQNKKGIFDGSITYNEFCEKILRMYIQLENLALYIHWLAFYSYLVNGKYPLHD
jgi:hypothetical protein